MDPWAETLARQHGVVTRTQALAHGLAPHDLRRMVRRRELSPLHPGVYVDHTGEPSWLQRAWAAVLACARPDGRAVASELGAALAGPSAMRAADGPGRAGGEWGFVHVAVPSHRRVTAPEGVLLVRSRGLEDRVLWNTGPPRMRYDEAALDVAIHAPGDLGAIGVIARAVQGRHTTAVRMQQALSARSRAPRRDFLEALLADVATGTCSVLEHGYLTLVERAHGFPVGSRQLRVGTASGVVYRDVAYGELLIELDGRLWHDTAEQRDADHERDLDAAVAGQGTVRLTYGQVLDRPCSTAAKLARILDRLGWPAGRACGAGCAVADVG